MEFSGSCVAVSCSSRDAKFVVAYVLEPKQKSSSCSQKDYDNRAKTFQVRASFLYRKTGLYEEQCERHKTDA